MTKEPVSPYTKDTRVHLPRGARYTEGGEKREVPKAEQGEGERDSKS